MVHSVSSGHLNNLQSQINTLPDQLCLALQCVLSYEKTLLAGEVIAAEKTSEKGDEILKKNIGNKKVENFESQKSESEEDACKQELLASSSGYDSSENDGLVCNHTMTNSSNTSGQNGGSNDTVVVGQNGKFFSPTDITFFSNQLTESPDSSPTFNVTNDCMKLEIVEKAEKEVSGKILSRHINPSNRLLGNIYHGNSIGSQGSEHNNSSISSELSKHSSSEDKTFNISPENDKPGMNINLPEYKVFAYEQYKVGNKLSTWSEQLKIDRFKDETKEKGVNKMMTEYDCFESEFRGRKLSNKIERETGPAPGKPLASYRWITLNDDRIGMYVCDIHPEPFLLDERFTSHSLYSEKYMFYKDVNPTVLFRQAMSCFYRRSRIIFYFVVLFRLLLLLHIW